jgi:hypothetical protein
VAADQVSDALDDLSDALIDNAADQRLLAKRVRSLQASRDAGLSWGAAFAAQTEPGVMTLASRTLSRLMTAGAALRRSVAAALRAEGWSIPAIAESFAVSHQRVSHLLQDRSEENART